MTRVLCGRDVVGKVWNGPNTAIGAAYGALGMGVGEVAFDDTVPKPPERHVRESWCS
jgi:hypothetical protein